MWRKSLVQCGVGEKLEIKSKIYLSLYYPFTTFTFGLCKSELGKMISKTILNVRRKGQGKKGFKIPVLFPINLGHILVIV